MVAKRQSDVLFLITGWELGDIAQACQEQYGNKYAMDSMDLSIDDASGQVFWGSWYMGTLVRSGSGTTFRADR